MIRPFATALLLGGLATLALPAGSSTAFSADEMQPEPQAKKPPSMYVYSGGHSYLGVDIRDVSSDRASALKLKEERGVEITMVDQDAPAGKAGLKEHDVILEFNGAAVDSEEQLRRMIREVPPGRTVTLGISRDGSPMKMSVKLAAHDKVVPEVFTVKPPVHIGPQMDIPGFALQLQSYSSALGIQTENLTRQLGEFFGVQNGEGILIRSVEKGSAGEKAGLKAGDVIVRADNEKLSGRMDLANILRKHHDGGKITLGVVRDKHEQAFVVTVPDRGPWDSSFLDLDSLRLDSGELQASLGNVRDAMKEMEKARDWTTLELDMPKIELEELSRELQKITPETEKAMRKAEEEMKRLQKQMEKQQREFKFDWDPFI